MNTAVGWSFCTASKRRFDTYMVRPAMQEEIAAWLKEEVAAIYPASY